MTTASAANTNEFYESARSSHWLDETLEKLQEIIGNDAGNRGMKALIVPCDLCKACKLFGRLVPSKDKAVIILSGFPCLVDQIPPTETDGPGGAVAIAKAAIGLGHNAIIVTDECNEAVFSAAMTDLPISAIGGTSSQIGASLEIFSSSMNQTKQEEKKFLRLLSCCQLLIACERAGPASDGNCYTMRGIDMTGMGLIAPLITSLVVQRHECKFIAIGDGGNEMGMGKVLETVRSNIPNGEKIACVISADFLIACSVSNWGAYTLSAGAAVVRAYDEIMCSSRQAPSVDGGIHEKIISSWLETCVPTDHEETQLLKRCVAVGCRDGLTGRQELTVDGFALEESLRCLRDIRKICHAPDNECLQQAR